MLHVDDYAAVPRERLRAESRANTVYTVAGAEAVVNRAMPQEQHREGAMLTGPVSERPVHLRVIILCNEMTRRKLRDSRQGSNDYPNRAVGSGCF